MELPERLWTKGLVKLGLVLHFTSVPVPVISAWKSHFKSWYC